MGSCQCLCQRNWNTQQSEHFSDQMSESPYKIKINRAYLYRSRSLDDARKVDSYSKIKFLSLAHSTKPQTSLSSTLKVQQQPSFQTQEENIETESSNGYQQIKQIPTQTSRHSRFIELQNEEICESRFLQSKKKKKHKQQQIEQDQKKHISELKQNSGSIEESSGLNIRCHSVDVKSILKHSSVGGNHFLSENSSSQDHLKNVQFSKETNFQPNRKTKRVQSISQQEFLKKLRKVLEKQRFQ